jgi:hypothetical protein
VILPKGEDLRYLLGFEVDVGSLLETTLLCILINYCDMIGYCILDVLYFWRL